MKKTKIFTLVQAAGGAHGGGHIPDIYICLDDVWAVTDRIGKTLSVIPKKGDAIQFYWDVTEYIEAPVTITSAADFIKEYLGEPNK